MHRRSVVPDEHVARFRSGRSSLDFVHSATDEHMHELIGDEHDLATWLAIVTDAPSIAVRRGDLGRAKVLREAIRLCALDVVAGVALDPVPLAVINDHAAAMPLVPVLGPGGEVLVQSGSASQALSSIARDAVELFSAELSAAGRDGPGHRCRLRVCAADDCGLFILDTSRPNNRRWCSMELCGNRSKIRAYRARSGD